MRHLSRLTPAAADLALSDGSAWPGGASARGRLLRTALAPAICALIVSGSAGARADSCRDMDALGVAVGALIGGVVVATASFIGPAIASKGEDSLSYWDGVGWSFLAGALGVGVGSLISGTVACEHGLWLPGATGLVGSIVGTVSWAGTASDDDGALSATSAPLRLRAGFAPMPGGAGLSLGLGF